MTFRKPLPEMSGEHLRQRIWQWWSVGKLRTDEIAKLAGVKECVIDRHLTSILEHRLAVRVSLARKASA